MNTPEHDDWERLFRQRLSDLEARPPADALARILAAARPSPVTTNPVSAARTLGAGGMVAVLLGIWLMQATQRPHNPLTESVQITDSRKTVSPTGCRPSEHTSLAEGKRERLLTDAPLTLGSAERRITTGPGPRTQPRYKVGSKDVLSTGRRPSGYSSLAKGKRERQSVTSLISATPGFSQKTTVIPTINPETVRFIAPDFNRWAAIDLVGIQRTVQPYRKFIQMAETTPQASPAAPAVARQRPVRDWFVALTPLYTYQQIAPVHTDERYVEQVQTLSAFSGGRAGWRAQIGVEQAINKQFAIRAGLTVSELRQSVQYRSRGAAFDSAKVEVLDNQTIRLTPLYRHQTGQLPGVRRFVGISADIIWRPARLLTASAGPNQRWQPYLTAGLSAGKYTGAGGELSGFWQASAGVERVVWPGH